MAITSRVVVAPTAPGDLAFDVILVGVEEVIILGTGTPLPVPERASSAVAITSEQSWMLVDCGRAATQRVIDTGLDLTKVEAVAITHHHSDHVNDLATFATVRWTSGATTPLIVVAPSGPAARFARHCLDAYDDQAFHDQAPPEAGPRPMIDVRAFDPPSDVGPVFSSGGWSVSSVLVDHHPIEPAVGYLVNHGGRRVAVSGDTSICDGMRSLARDADVLVHEAIGSGRPELRAWNASAYDVGLLAAEAKPGIVVLTHMIPAPSSPDDEERYADEARSAGFDGPVVVARDLLHIPVDAA